MKPFDPAENHQLRAAEGWFELGLLDDALAELRGLSGSNPAAAEASRLRWRIHAARGDWRSALDAAGDTVALEPDDPNGWVHRSFCLHELKRTAEAWDLLESVAPRFPDDPVIPYNLACYACQLGRETTAKLWLERAALVWNAGDFKGHALKDPDLQPIKDYIEAM
jgi:predicted Zn-dependent protease